MVGVSCENHFSAFASAADDGFHLMRSQILRLVDNYELARYAAASDVSDCFELQLVVALQLVDLAADGLGVALLRMHEIVEDVVDWLHPGFELFVFVAWQVADVVSERDDWP